MEFLFPASVVEITFPVDFHAGIRIIWELAFTENIATKAFINMCNVFLGHSSFFAQTRIRMIDMAKRKTWNTKRFMEQLGLLGQRHLDEFYVAREGGIVGGISIGELVEERRRGLARFAVRGKEPNHSDPLWLIDDDIFELLNRFDAFNDVFSVPGIRRWR